MTGTGHDVKRYQRTKLIVSLAGGFVSFAFTLFLLASGITRQFEQAAFALTPNIYLALLLFSLFFGTVSSAASLPFSFFSGFILEHRYGMSNQSFAQWCWEGFKGMLISLPIMLPLALLGYFFLVTFDALWWLPVAVMVFIVSIGLSRIAPVLILPLFYTLTPLEDSPLKERILQLVRSTGMTVEGIYTFNLSKTTKKANAAFTGIGRSKRILLGDTLMENFTPDEIETVFAHELGHYTHGHIWKGIVTGTLSIFIGLFLTSLAYDASLSWFGFTAVTQLAALPLLTLWLGLYSLVTSPLSNTLSRRHEFEADRYAVERTGNRPAFVSTMNKLASMNLADRTPHPLVEFLFYSHPSIEKRIAAAGGTV
ncbi:MAG: M48 family metallopeptidase [Bacteroidetes bacterium]|nr:M48 family metallopeptidase [Bacteroidota bacterium]